MIAENENISGNSVAECWAVPSFIKVQGENKLVHSYIDGSRVLITGIRDDGDTNKSLASGIYGYQLAQAAELVRDYEGWKSEEFEEFKRYMMTTSFKSQAAESVFEKASEKSKVKPSEMVFSL